ncbi:MAG: T9SS type A sorting domain-containing protein [Candidatus Marinimicrobia bacterium]|nr:T9SS type A sorting domain-containing protein [Candidatus Neomarinimicrobiota bacterium]
MRVRVPLHRMLILTMLVTLPMIAHGQWEYETVTVGGKKCAIAVDADGNPHISHVDPTDHHYLNYAHWDGTDWQIAGVETTESVYGVTSIALDESENPHIAFFSGGMLHRAWWNGSTWQKEEVDGNASEYNSIAIDGDGYPHIAYRYYKDGPYLKYAYKDASGWHRSIADSLPTDSYLTSMALDGNNNPHISYYNGSGYDLKYAYWDGSNWLTETVDAVGSRVGKYNSIALDSLDYPCIAYSDDGVKYARWNGSAWQIETVDPGNGYGFYTSLALDANDRPHISSGVYGSDLRYAYWDGSDWQIEVVDNTVGCDWTSLAIDDSGYCHIAYNDGSDSANLKYAKRILTTGVEETASRPIQEVFHLAQNYPNPFNPVTTISYELPKDSDVTLTIYDITGRLIETLVDQKQNGGHYSVQWDAFQYSSGVYIYRIKTPDFSDVRKCLLIK